MRQVQRTLLEAFGIVVRNERIRKGLTQEKLAELANLHHNFVSMVERGKSAPALDTIEAIASALGRRPSQLLRAAERQLSSSGSAPAPTVKDRPQTRHGDD